MLSRLSYLLAPLALCGGVTLAHAADCPGHPDALGVSRTIVVDPHDHIRIGLMSYKETLPLADHEVVLTFDDGPLPPYSDKILDILAAECVHATYFIIGTMAKAYPDTLPRVYQAGHTIGTHSMTHPTHFKALGADAANAQIDNGIAATKAALGDAADVAPFFRFPGFGRTDAAEQHLASLGLMAWGADVPADDWMKISPAEVARRALRRLDAKGRGILLLHDIHERTVEALPLILQGLKERGFRIVHVVPSSPERPPTVTAAADWLPYPRVKVAGFTMPVIRIADVQEPDGEILLKKTADERCELRPPARARTALLDKAVEHETVGMREHRAEPPIRAAARHHARRSRIAHAPAAVLVRDIHAVE
jgi:peptidoglycan/xylan/chitin deacetylase (PgdA/CDA1 family)